jgi:cation transport regulator ChaB
VGLHYGVHKEEALERSLSQYSQKEKRREDGSSLRTNEEN